MKKLFFILVLLPSIGLAEGPLFHHEETEKQQEFENVYKDLRRVGLIKFVQVKTFSVTTSSSCHTNGVTWTPTNLSGSVTLSSGTKVFVIVSGSIRTSDAGSVGARSTIYRDSTNLDTTGNGMNYILGGFVGALETPTSPMAWDTTFSPGTTVTYAVRVRGDSSGTVTWNTESQTSTMTIIEISGI